MFDEIMFRAWDKVAKHMLTWEDNADDVKDAIPYGMGDEWTEQCELMQYTGLEDKNGERIFEGDVVAIYPDNLHNAKKYGKRSVFVVEKEDGFWGFEWRWRRLSGYAFSTHIMEDNPVNYEVIGNIYENPAYLKKRKK